MKTVGLTMAVLGCLLLAACTTAGSGGTDPAPTGKADALPVAADAWTAFGTGPWTLAELPAHGGGIPRNTREPLTLQLVTGDAGPELRGQGGCNSYSMGVMVNGAALKPGPIRASKMACEHLAFETAYFGILGKIDTVRRDGETLQLLSAGTVVASYRR